MPVAAYDTLHSTSREKSYKEHYHILRIQIEVINSRSSWRRLTSCSQREIEIVIRTAKRSFPHLSYAIVCALEDALYCDAIRHRVHMHGFFYHFRDIESKDIGIEHYHKAYIKVLAELII
jgi:hypothetical protein